MVKRGVIRNREFSTQIRNHSGLTYRCGITPTDIDVAVEFGNRLFVFIELKHGNADVPKGQRIFLERICDSVGENSSGSTAKRHAIVLIAHDFHTKGPEQDIDTSRCTVSKYRYEKEWRRPLFDTTVRQAIDKTLTMLGMQEYIA